MDDIQFDHKWVGRNGDAIIRATIGEDVVCVEKFDVSKPAARLKFLNRLKERIPATPDDQAEQYLTDLASEGMDRDKHRDSSSPPEKEDSTTDSGDLLAAMPEAVRQSAREMLDDENLVERIGRDIAALGVAGENELALAVYLIGTSRLLPRPLAAIVQGVSSTGKSFVPDIVSQLFPAESLERASEFTPNALYYMPAGSLKHRFVIAGERQRSNTEESQDRTKAIREMLSTGRISKRVTISTGTGPPQTVHVYQAGPIAFIESTTKFDVFNEDANRCLLLATDDSSRQTERIISTIARRNTGESFGDCDAIIQRHHALQRMLKPFPIVVPFAERLGHLFPSTRPESRRAFPNLLSMIQAIALLHQCQRQFDDTGRLIADEDDYQLARALCSKPLARILDDRLPESAVKFFDRLRTYFALEEVFTTRKAIDEDLAGSRSIQDWLSVLAEQGLVEQVEQSRGNRPASWKIIKGSVDSADVLPQFSDVFG